MYKFREIPIKILVGSGIEKLILKFIWEYKRPIIARCNKNWRIYLTVFGNLLVVLA